MRPDHFAVVLGVAVAVGVAYAALMLRMALKSPLGEYIQRGLGPLFRFAGVHPPIPQPAVSTHERAAR